MNVKEVAIALIIMLVILGGGIFFFSRSESKQQEAKLTFTGAIDESDHVKGATQSASILIEYSDFQCPACSAFHPILKQIMDEFGNQLKLAYRYFPLIQIHKNSQTSASAAEAAGKQGKFWEMHDLLFEFQNEWANESDPSKVFDKYADSLKLDMEKFHADKDSQAVKDKVNKDYQSGMAIGINSTPTFFLNGEQLTNPSSLDEFKQKISASFNQTPQ